MVAKELKENYIKPHGLVLSIDEYKPSRTEGSKQDRIASVLEPRYDNMMVWHYQGGNCQILEDELVSAYPPHDDIADALASVVGILVKPTNAHYRASSANIDNSKTLWHPRFGGRAY